MSKLPTLSLPRSFHLRSNSQRLSQWAHRALVGLILFGLCALPASAGTWTSSLKTGAYTVLPGQTISVSVANVANYGQGGSLSIVLYDREGEAVAEIEEGLSAGRTTRLLYSANQNQAVQVRAVVEMSHPTSIKAEPVTVIEVYEIGGLVAELKVVCDGPASFDPGAEFHTDCPGIRYAGHHAP